ncbi:MAG TPA: aminotransferase class I/II-fold pyridoxal phosphate-dependent enzyme [Sphingobacterium sp.]|nr:aminotransferase class I/II-fold pyridoxal phosphate-dependent enzyme [Sphingobacterium sp.]
MKDYSKVIRTQSERTQYREHSTPLYLSSSFIFNSAEQSRAVFAGEEDAMVYSRYDNPNTTELIDKVCTMEQAEAGLTFASGMSAIFTTLASLCKSGDHIVASRAVFGSTHQILTQLLEKWKISHTYVELTDNSQWENAIQPNTRLLFLESPSNPGLEVADLSFLGRLKEKHPELILIIDNCFATPYLQKPLTYGFDISIHSATKYMDGQGRVLGGIAVGQTEFIDELQFLLRHTGPALSPFNAWIISKSLETLHVRMDRHSSNALELAKSLEKHPKIKKTIYPFLPSHPQYNLAKKQMKSGGGIVTFEIEGGAEKATQFINRLNMIRITSNLGDTRTIVTHPASTTHSKLSKEERAAVSIFDGTIRISVGLEDIEDIKKDILQALEK